jgi:hypothetical protein
MTFRRRQCCLTRACSRQAGLAPGSARAAHFLDALWNEGWCGRQHEGPQLMRKSLGSNEHRKRGGRRGEGHSLLRYTIGGTLT